MGGRKIGLVRMILWSYINSTLYFGEIMTLELVLTILPFVAMLASIIILLTGKWMYWKQRAKYLELLLKESEVFYMKAIEIALRKEE